MSGDDRPNVSLDARLVAWVAASLLADEHARLIESGVDREARVPLARVFVDLIATRCLGRCPTKGSALRELVRSDARGEEGEPETTQPLWLLLGGAGAGKSTVTAMAAQLLRATWVTAQPDAVPVVLREHVEAVIAGLRAAWSPMLAEAAQALPVRVNLPTFAHRLVGTRTEPTAAALYDHLAAAMGADLRAAGQDVECNGAEMRAMVQTAGRIAWLFDGLDEVPAGDARAAVSRVVHEVIAARRQGDRVLVTTRPQGYGGEFDDLPAMELDPLDWLKARIFCERLVKAMGRPVDAHELDVTLTREFQRPEVRALASSPLHAAIVASFIERQDELPRARWELFDRYFHVLFDREQRKLNAVGVKSEHRGKVFELHARAGLALHVRAQAQPSSTLAVRELRAMMVALYQEDGLDEEHADERASQLLRFASERLVLLLRVSEGGYAFGIRPLQEFFAARALWTLDAATLRVRLDAVATSSHWANVLTLLASGAAVMAVDVLSRRAAMSLVEVCRALNEGVLGGAATARCMLGSRLAIALLREVDAYAGPWLLDPLWKEALRIADAPVQRDALEWVRKSDVSGRGEGVSAVWDDNEEVHIRLGLLACRGAGASNERRREDLLARAEQRMGGGEGERWAAWHLLLPALGDDVPDAVRIVLAHPPTTLDEAQSFVRATLVFTFSARVPRIVRELAQALPNWFTPGRLYKVQYAPWQDDDAWPPALRIAALLRRAAQREFSVLFLASKFWAEAMKVVPLAGLPDDIWKQIGALASTGIPHAHVWTKVAAFHRDPTSASLADLLVDLEAEALTELNHCRRAFAWPLAACLAHVDDATQLDALVTALRTGVMGDIEAWLDAESRWRETPALDATTWASWVAAPGPWRPGEKAPPITYTHFSRRRFEPAPTPEHYHDTILGALASQGILARRAIWAAELTLSEFHRMDIWTAGVPYEIASRFQDVPASMQASTLTAVDAMIPDLDATCSDDWLQLLDARGRRGLTTLHDGRRPTLDGRAARNLLHIARHVTNHPERWGLAQVLIALLFCVPDAPLDSLTFRTPAVGVSAHGAAWWSLLALLSSPLDDVAAAMAVLRGTHEGKPFDYRNALARILAFRTRDPARTEKLLLAALDIAHDDDFLTRESLLGSLLAHLRRTAPLAFTDASAWEDTFHFAPPHIAMQPAPASPPCLRSIDALTNLRLFRETPLVGSPFPTPSPDRGQWVVVLGENGVGKTTLLRALALALVSPEVASKQLHSRLPLVRNGGPASLGFTLSTGTYRVEVSRVDGGATESVTLVGDPPSERPWVVGYGVRRGGALGEEGRVVDWATEGNLHTLFERQPALVVAQDWLLKLDRRVQRERAQALASGSSTSTPAGDLWNAVVAALKRALELLDVTAGDDDVVYIEHRDFGRVRLESLSDGYLATAGWIVDLIARWVRQREADGDLLVGDILGQMTGLVLIDEIDLHLHPRWQMRVIDDVRRIFPRLSFVVTTHNPLTLQGARPGEVFVMSWGDGARIGLQQRNIQPGHDIDRVLLEQFGIEHTFDRETREWLSEHRQLMVAGAAPDDPRRVELERKLAERLGTFGEAVVAQRGGAPLSDVQRSNLERFKQRRGARTGG